jgi:hypothetical protein
LGALVVTIDLQSVALYQQMALSGLLKDVTQVAEFGTQGAGRRCDIAQLAALHLALGREPPDTDRLQVLAIGSARDLFQSLGLSCTSIEFETSVPAGNEADQILRLDLNRDAVPAAHRQRYDLVLNHGTTARVLNQLNAFQLIHDLTRIGGLMLHVLSFRGAYSPAFFNIQPEMLRALARSNGYEIAGWWLLSRSGPAAVLPWVDDTIDYLKLSDPHPWALAVLFRRLYPQEFFVPYQFIYEEHRSDINAVRYNYMVDGEVLSGTILKSIKLGQIGAIPPGTKLSDVPFRNLVREGRRRVTGAVQSRSVQFGSGLRSRTRRAAVAVPTWLYWKPMSALVGEESARALYFKARRTIGRPSPSDPGVDRR